MPRKRGAVNGLPWYLAGKDLWKVTIEGREITLRHPNGGPIKGNTKAAFQAAVAAAGLLKSAGRIPTTSRVSVRRVLTAYLDDSKVRLKQTTLDTYSAVFHLFNELFGDCVAEQLHPDDFKRWFARHKDWGPTTRNAHGTFIKAAFAWAAAAGRGRLLSFNPIEGLRLPTPKRRSHDTVVTTEEFERWLLAAAANNHLCDLMRVAWETGSRPVNLSRAKVSDLRSTMSALVIDDHKTATKSGRPLVIPLTGAALAVIQRRASGLGPDALLFRTARGLPWNKTRLASLVMYYSDKVGLKGRLTAYSCRHTLATRLLESGVSPVDVAAILGNTPAIIHRHYSHVAADGMRLRRILEGGAAGSPPAPPNQTGKPDDSHLK